MLLALFILGVALIGWFLPRLVVRRWRGGGAVTIGVIAAWAVAACVVWLGAQAAGALGVEPAHSAFERGLNAWKIILLLAPASALHARRQLLKEDG